MMAFLRQLCYAPTSDWIDKVLVVEGLAPPGQGHPPQGRLPVEIAVHT